jgi:hypothetical protein
MAFSFARPFAKGYSKDKVRVIDVHQWSLTGGATRWAFLRMKSVSDAQRHRDVPLSRQEDFCCRHGWFGWLPRNWRIAASANLQFSSLPWATSQAGNALGFHVFDRLVASLNVKTDGMTNLHVGNALFSLPIRDAANADPEVVSNSFFVQPAGLCWHGSALWTYDVLGESQLAPSKVPHQHARIFYHPYMFRKT